MITRLFNRFKKPTAKIEEPVQEKPRSVFSTYNDYNDSLLQEKIESAISRNFKKSIHPELKNTLDAASKSPHFSYAQDDSLTVKSSFYGNDVVPEQQLLWYANHTFIGYQLCAMMAQQWLVSKCCLMPAEDATRKGYDLAVNDGSEIDPEILDAPRKYDIYYNIGKNLIEFIQFGRIFGIRIAMFHVESSDPDYYFKPFNPDGVEPGSYKGISQIDPYWITPQLNPEAAGDPASIHFYEPTWWNIAGKLVHRTHLVIYRTEEVADILKPSYNYGGVPIPQKIYERVYAAERTANEAPMLALTKRTDVINVDTAQSAAQQAGFVNRLQLWTQYRDNYGVKVLGTEESMQQFDTSLADLDAVIMTQYQLVAAAANVPAVKLLGTSPKGFNTTGEYEEASYHEMLESLQKHALTPLLERHHLLLIRSEIVPEFNIEPFDVSIAWKPLDAMTGKELAELNKLKADAGQVLMATGAIDGSDERNRIINDPNSGYSGLIDEESLIEPFEENSTEELLNEQSSAN